MARSIVKTLRRKLRPAHVARASGVEHPYPAVDLVSWAPKDGRRNFGDHLSRVVVAAVAARRQLTLEDQVPTDRRLLAIGSILHLARDGDVIWGSGVNGKIDLRRLTARNLDVRAVRGPKTAAVLRGLGVEVPEVYGDPAMLVSLLFARRFPVRSRSGYVVVPNLHDLAKLADQRHTISPLLGWNVVAAAIHGSEMVVSSSLHGIILAESFGVPARMLRVSETEAQFKYDDYAQSTGRDQLEAATTIEAALKMGGHPAPVIDREKLLDAFPYDLWA